MPFWKRSKRHNLLETPKKGVIPTLEEPNITLLRYSVIGDTAAAQSRDSNVTLLSRPCSSIGSGELEEHLPDRQLKLYIATWNMEGKAFPSNLEDLLRPLDDEFAKDIYVIGIQEGCPNRRQWELKIQETLGAGYALSHSSAHGVLYLTIFVRRELIRFCSEVRHARVTTRIFHYVKTKGALGVAFTIFGTSLLFISSHLRYGANNKRIQDYRTITEGLCRLQTPSEGSNARSGDVTSHFDHVFWFGDLNFQLNEDRTTVESLLQNIRGRDMSSLLQHDQLNEAKSQGSIFPGFMEHTIRFAPTYKFDIGTDIYDTSEKQRIPSYTDRVLYKSKHEGDVRVLRYDSCPLLKTSDHRPVFAIFEVKLKPR